MTAEIDDNDTVIDGQMASQPTPIRAITGPPMQHEHRRPLAMVRIEQLNVVRDQRHRHLKRPLSYAEQDSDCPTTGFRMAGASDAPFLNITDTQPWRTA